MRKALQLSLNEMAVLCEIYSLSNNTDYNGWCYKSKQKIGETLDLSKATVITICNTLEVKGYINRHPETKFLQPTNWIRHVAQEQDNFAFMVKSDGFLVASAKMQSIIEEKMGGSESLPSVGNFTDSVKKLDQVGKESLPKYNNSNTDSYTDKEIYKEKFEIFRKEYRGSKRGLDEEFKCLQKHKDWMSVCEIILQNYKHQLSLRELKRAKGEFIPPYKNLKTYLNNRCWTEDMDVLAQGLTDEEKGRLQRLDQYNQFEGHEYMVKNGLWDEYQDLKQRYAANSNK